MKLNLSRSTVLICSVYTFVIGVIMLVLSILSLVAYECVFQEGFASTPDSYFFHLFYYRSHHCNSFIDWSVFGLENAELLNDFIIMPEQNAIVSRTYKLTIIQIIINSLLIVVSLIAVAAVIFNIFFLTKRIAYIVLFVPYLLVLHVSVVFDFIAGTLYADDRLRSYSVDGTMTMLEIENRNEARPFIEQIDQTFRIIAPNTMFFIFTKAMIINIINVFVLFFMVFAGWEVIDGNKLKVNKKDDSKNPENITAATQLTQQRD
ncbi:unnamed protein product [Chironomus riparius]|uniref:Uncharacterized protein n=1 Tax=Chironomus riparius TaxID=315576 RepID=A0A9N9RNS1_9DIPT|nr:unnamed protein product [Chironomus riparius]